MASHTALRRDSEEPEDDDRIADRDEAAHRADDRCPRCQAVCPAPNLLTSMTRYYTCRGCDYRWQVMRGPI